MSAGAGTPSGSDWQGVIGAAVLGADRGRGLPRLSPVIEAAVARAEEDPAARLLHAAALASVHDRAGRVAGAHDAEVEPPVAPADAPACSRAAAALLAPMLAGEHEEALPEWLAGARRAGCGASDELVPALLDRALAERDEELRAACVEAAGARGRWLASLEPRWEPLVDPGASEDPLEAFRTGAQPRRVAALRELLARDRAAARDLVWAAWKMESADSRLQLLGGFARAPQAGDEDLLESGLADRSGAVRALAAAALAALPGSAWRGRTLERAVRALHADARRGVLRRESVELEVTLPDESDAALVRELVEIELPARLGKGARLLARLVAGTTLDDLASALGARAEDLLDAAGRSDHAVALLAGLAAAARRDAAWAGAVLALLPDAGDDVRQALRPFVGELVQALDAPSRERVALQLMERGDALAHFALAACTHAWSGPFTGRAIASLFAGTTDRPAPAEAAARLRSTFPHPAAGADALRRLLADAPADSSPTVLARWSAALALLDHRRRIHEELP